MIVAGGTGGHVYPGLAVAECLRAAGCELYWMGTRRGVEARVVPGPDVAFLTIPVSGLRRHGLLRWATAPAMLLMALACAVYHILRHRPRVVLGMGGFVSGPGCLAAWLCRRPLVIHEQNAVPGLTNRWLSHLARQVLEAFPGSFPATIRAEATGNPVRAEIAGMAPPHERMQDRRGAHVLVFGGSRGARALNELVPAALVASGVPGMHVRHQCGADDIAATEARYAASGVFASVIVEPYIDDMAGAYAAADLVIARAGAITVAELAACGVAAILIPYPYAVDDHQTANARYLVDNDAAVVFAERTLTAAALGTEIRRLFGARERLLAMAVHARAAALPHAAQQVAQRCLEYVDVQR